MFLIRRHSKPYKPLIPGLYESFLGTILHSRSYRIPEVFTDENVVILGAGASGVDIATDLSGHAKKVYLSHRHKESVFFLIDSFSITKISLSGVNIVKVLSNWTGNLSMELDVQTTLKKCMEL